MNDPAARTAPPTRRPKILVALPIFDETLARLREHADVDAAGERAIDGRADLLARAADCDGMFVAGSPKVDAELLDACPRLKVVASMAVGFDNIDVAACTARGVMASNAPDVLTETTADFGFALMMAAARRVGEAERFLRDGRWTTWRHDMLAGSDVHGATLGILGMGRIGQALARRGAKGFAMPVIYHNRRPIDAALEAGLGARWVDKATLMAESDHLVVTAPATPETRHAIGEAELAMMKPTATLTNIGRGGVIDDAALVAALRQGRPGAAALDVFEGEPAFDRGLLTLPNAVLTPHIASASLPTRRAMAALAVRNLLAVLGVGPEAGRPPTPLNAEVLGAAPRR